MIRFASEDLTKSQELTKKLAAHRKVTEDSLPQQLADIDRKLLAAAEKLHAARVTQNQELVMSYFNDVEILRSKKWGLTETASKIEEAILRELEAIQGHTILQARKEVIDEIGKLERLRNFELVSRRVDPGSMEARYVVRSNYEEIDKAISDLREISKTIWDMREGPLSEIKRVFDKAMSVPDQFRLGKPREIAEGEMGRLRELSQSYIPTSDIAARDLASVGGVS